MNSSRLYGKPMQRIGDSSHDNSDKLEDSVYETDNSDLESDYFEGISNHSYGEKNTTQDDDDVY